MTVGAEQAEEEESTAAELHIEETRQPILATQFAPVAGHAPTSPLPPTEFVTFTSGAPGAAPAAIVSVAVS